MHSFCEDSFWNNSVSWDTLDPNFTSCFQQTVLAYIPLVVLLFLSPIELVSYWQKANPGIRWNILNTGKLVTTLSLVAASVVEVYLLLEHHSLHSVDAEVLAALGGAASYVCSTMLLMHSLRQVLLLLSFKLIVNFRVGSLTSGPLFMFWAADVIVNSIRARTRWLHYFEHY